MTQLTLAAPAATGAPGLPGGYEVRPVAPEDTEAVGRRYFAAYDPRVACDTEEEAIADVAATFAGEYGPVWLPGALAVGHGGELVAAVLTTHPAPWDGTPPGPFVVELFTARAHRRRGLARELLTRVLDAAHRADPPEVGLRVDDANVAAVALYRSLGFREWGGQW